MKLRKPLIITAIALTSLAASGATPASADDTTTTFTLIGGSLVLSVQAGATLVDAASGITAITGSLGAVSVTDGRGVTAPWEVSAASSAFTGVLGSSSTSVSYTAGAVVETGTITVADGGVTAINSTEPVVSPDSLSGNNTASWTPTLDVTMPANALADDYTGTVTTSIL